MPLSRYLYAKDEIALTLLECLLQKRSVKEAFFWISEYYYSGYETWPLIWKIYYDFYAVTYPTFEKHILILQRSHKNDMTTLLVLIGTFYNMKPSPDVFLLRHTIKCSVKINTCHDSIHSFPEKYRALLSCVHCKKFECLWEILESCKKYDDMYSVIIQYYKQEKNMELREAVYFTFDFYKNKAHILLALIIHLECSLSRIHKNIPVHRLSNVTKKWVHNINTLNCSVFSMLKEKRVYSISDSIGSFSLKRYEKGSMSSLTMLRYHWEYYASFTPLWKKRFNALQANRRIRSKELLFDDDMSELFDEKYNYEPDEQSLAVQLKSALDIPRLSAKEWLFRIFGKQMHAIQNIAQYFPKYI